MAIKLTGSTGVVTPGLEVDPSTSAIRISIGTTAQRPSVNTGGWFRFNSETNKFEGYNGTFWGSVGGGATGGGNDEIFILNSQSVTASYTLPAGKNASTTGPINVDNNVTITVSSGSRWVIL